jgi:GTPase
MTGKVQPTAATVAAETCTDVGNNATTVPCSVQEVVLDKISNRHTRVAVLGNVDAGKSTLIGGLTSDTLDDGRGKSRHHETQSKFLGTCKVHLDSDEF